MDEGIKLQPSADRPTDRIPGGVCNTLTTFPRRVQINDHYKFALPFSISGKRHSSPEELLRPTPKWSTPSFRGAARAADMTIPRRHCQWGESSRVRARRCIVVLASSAVKRQR